MPCANGTSVLMKFDYIVNAVSYICELAHALSTSLFHWTFCHAVPDSQCECGISVPQIGVVLEEAIMKLYSKSLPLLSQQKINKIKKTIMHHIGKEYNNQKQLRKVPKDENMINCINKHQGQRRHQNKINKDTDHNKVQKQASRAKQTPEQRGEYNKVHK